MLRNRRRVGTVQHKMRDAICRLNRPPSLRGDIDMNKHITRKQRRRGLLDLACMPAQLQIARQIYLEALTHEIAGGPGLRIDLRLHDIPSAFADRGHLTTSPWSEVGKRR